MRAPTPCRICGGQLMLRYRGTMSGLDADALSPTCHRTGEHGDLYECVECGTLHQPALPPGAELESLYRSMRDDAYLAEEAGRRRTARRTLDMIRRHVPAGRLPDGGGGRGRAARRLLDMIGRYVPAGRLLDVGCGHGLLLDEARRRGYEAEGLELSRDAAAYAREVLELRVHELPLDRVDGGEGYAAIV